MSDDLDLGAAQGTTGEPATQVAAGSGPSDEELLAALDEKPAEATPSASSDLDPELLKRLEGIDPEKLPASLRQKLELPFLRDYTRKSQDVAQQQARLLESVTSKLAAHGAEPTVDEVEMLRERVRSGDPDAVESLISKIVQDRVGPMQQQTALREATEQAERMHPLIKEHPEIVTAALQANPDLLALARADNFRHAPVIMAGLAYQAEAMQLRQRVAGIDTEKKEYARQVLQAFQRKTSGLPPTTSMAGVSSGTPSEPLPATVKDAAKQAWAQMGGAPVEHW
jgi:hypothetical protein